MSVFGAVEEITSGGAQSHYDTYNEDPLIHDEGLLESYTKIWESFPEKDSSLK